MQVQRLTPEGAFPDWLKGIEKRVKGLETRTTGSIVVEPDQTLKTTDPVTGVATIFGNLPDGSTGLKLWVGDTTPPPVPTTPLVSSALGTITMLWSGSFSGTATAPADFSHINAYSQNVTGGMASLAGSMRSTNDSVIFSGIALPGQQWVCWLTSVDANGNESAASVYSSPITVASVLDDSGLSAALANNQTQINTANANIAAANTAIASKSSIVSASIAPTGAHYGDYWIDTSNANKPMFYNGAWVSAQDVGFIDASRIAANTIISSMIAANTIVANNIAANTITTNQIAASTITSTNIAASAITADRIAGGTITATQIAVGTITAANIAASAITANKISAGAIDGMVITGATIQTAASGARIVLNSSALNAWNASGVNYLTADNTGLSLAGTVSTIGSVSTGATSSQPMAAYMGQVPIYDPYHSGSNPIRTVPGLGFTGVSGGKANINYSNIVCGIWSPDGVELDLTAGGQGGSGGGSSVQLMQNTATVYGWNGVNINGHGGVTVNAEAGPLQLSGGPIFFNNDFVTRFACKLSVPAATMQIPWGNSPTTSGIIVPYRVTSSLRDFNDGYSVSAAGEITIPYAGLYSIIASVGSGSGNSVGYGLKLYVEINRTYVGASEQPFPGGPPWINPNYAVKLRLNAGDTVRVRTFVTGASTSATIPNSGETTFISLSTG